MASVASVAFIKGIPSAVAAHKSAPKPGSTLRRIFDALHERSGLPTRLDGVSKAKSAIENLRTSYGLDIRAIRHGRAGGTQWVLAGEWFGTRYVDYVAQRLGGPVAKKIGPAEISRTGPCGQTGNGLLKGCGPIWRSVTAEPSTD